jgi:hypothetical protein
MAAPPSPTEWFTIQLFTFVVNAFNFSFQSASMHSKLYDHQVVSPMRAPAGRTGLSCVMLFRVKGVKGILSIIRREKGARIKDITRGKSTARRQDDCRWC